MSKKILTFYLDGKLFGVDIILVKEINRGVEYIGVPGSKSYIAGLFNMRGLIVTLFDLPEIMGIGSLGKCMYNTCIILKASKDNPDWTGFLIERSGEVVEVDEKGLAPPPANTGSIESRFIEYVAKLKDDIIIVIDPIKIFNTMK